MRATAALALGWAAFAIFILWLSYQPWPLTFVWPQPPSSLYDDYWPPHDTWTGYPH